MSVSTSSRSTGQRAAASRTSAGVLEGDHPAEGQGGPEVEAPAGLVRPPGEAVDDGPLGDPAGRQDVEGVVPRLPGVDDQGQAVAAGQLDLEGEGLPLDRSRGEWS